MSKTEMWIEPYVPVYWFSPFTWLEWLVCLPDSLQWKVMSNRSFSSVIYCEAVCKNKREAKKKLKELL